MSITVINLIVVACAILWAFFTKASTEQEYSIIGFGILLILAINLPLL